MNRKTFEIISTIIFLSLGIFVVCTLLGVLTTSFPLGLLFIIFTVAVLVIDFVWRKVSAFREALDDFLG